MAQSRLATVVDGYSESVLDLRHVEDTAYQDYAGATYRPV